jgi:periplasmic copper chaperone A
MKKLLIFIVVGMFLTSGCGMRSTEIEVHDPWARTALKNENTAIYLIIHNHSENADEMIGASTDVAEITELHKTEEDANGMMQMNLQSSVPLPADGEISFQPGGLHIMLTGLKQDLNIGDMVTLTLHFRTHADIVLSVPVVDVAGMNHSNMDMDNMHTP